MWIGEKGKIFLLFANYLYQFIRGYVAMAFPLIQFHLIDKHTKCMSRNSRTLTMSGLFPNQEV
jgi:hypothetical protein